MTRGFLDDDDRAERSTLIDISVRLVHQTEAAWLVDDGARQVWVPKSWGELAGGVLSIPESRAIQKRLI